MKYDLDGVDNKVNVSVKSCYLVYDLHIIAFPYISLDDRTL